MAKDAAAAEMRGIDRSLKVPKKHNKKDWVHSDLKGKVNSKRSARYTGELDLDDEDIRNYLSR